MSINFRYVQTECNSDSLKKQVSGLNNPALPDGVIDKIMDEFYQVNERAVMEGDTIFIPILPPFQKKYSDLIDRDDILQNGARRDLPAVEEPAETVVAEPEKVVPVENPIEKPVMPKVTVPSTQDLTAHEKAELRPIRKVGQISYRVYPYTFTRPNETIEAVVRLYNDMNVSRSVINKLVYEFSEVNKEALPPKLGQTVKVPVLLPFCYRHENDNKIFTDE